MKSIFYLLNFNVTFIMVILLGHLTCELEKNGLSLQIDSEICSRVWDHCTKFTIKRK